MCGSPFPFEQHPHAQGSVCSGAYIASAAICIALGEAPESARLSSSSCASSSGVVAKTYSLMKHCRASAQANPRTGSPTGLPVAASLASASAQRGQQAFERDIAHRRRLQKNEQQRVGRDCGKSGFAEQFALGRVSSARLPSAGARLHRAAAEATTSVARIPEYCWKSCGISASARA